MYRRKGQRFAVIITFLWNNYEKAATPHPGLLVAINNTKITYSLKDKLSYASLECKYLPYFHLFISTLN